MYSEVIKKTIIDPIKEIGIYKFCRMIGCEHRITLEILKNGCDDPYKYKYYFYKICEFYDLDMCDFIADIKKDVHLYNCQDEVLFIKEKQKKVRDEVEKLKDPLKTVIKMRFFEEMTLEETGKILCVSRERIRQVEAEALRIMKLPSRSKQLREFYEN